MTSPRTFALPQTCDVRNAAELYAGIVAALTDGPVVLDARQVTHCDTGAAQLFCAAARDPHVTWWLSEPLRTQLAELALSTHFTEGRPS